MCSILIEYSGLELESQCGAEKTILQAKDDVCGHLRHGSEENDYVSTNEISEIGSGTLDNAVEPEMTSCDAWTSVGKEACMSTLEARIEPQHQAFDGSVTKRRGSLMRIVE